MHHEDMGIPKDVAKLGVRHGMWGAVKKLHCGVRAYQIARKPGDALSRSALMAAVTTKITSHGGVNALDLIPGEEKIEDKRQKDHGIDWKWLVLGGTVALACGLHSGVIGKAMLLGAGNRFVRR